MFSRATLYSRLSALLFVSLGILGSPLPSAAQQNQSIATLASFPRVAGFHYPGSLLQVGDNFYGTSCEVIPVIIGRETTYTYRGTFFRMAPDGTLTNLVSFPTIQDSPNQLGFGPFSGVVQDADGNFYGTTYVHGATPDALAGMVYKITTAGELVTLHYFSGGDDGGKPRGGLVQGADGNFYGTTSHGGLDDNGTVFRISPVGELTTLYRFGGGADGATSFGTLILASDGNFYGTTTSGGAGGAGTVFRMTPDGDLATLYSFPISAGHRPYAGLVQGAEPAFYGRTVNPETRAATLFRISSQGDLTTLHAFADGTDNTMTSVALTLGSDGLLYGTTGQGGPPHLGTIFAISPDGVLTTLYYFNDASRDGVAPIAPLRQARDGLFYGTSSGGGTDGAGTIFAIAPLTALATVHHFVPPEGSGPLDILLATDGNFYGTTANGPLGVGYGTVFSLTPEGVLTTLHTFTGPEGYRPNNGLIQARDGNFYGTASQGGSANRGTIFKMTAAGSVTVLYSPPGGIGGESPAAGVIEGSDGNFYGTTSSGGTTGAGMVFRMTPDGNVTPLHSFDGTDGANPAAALLQASDGNLYGTTSRAGGFGQIGGTVFQITPDGALTTLHAFNPSQESPSPLAQLIEGSDGALWGTTSGQFIAGRVFEITTGGALSNLHSFDNTEGGNPAAPLLLAADGNFYGIIGPGGSTIAGAGIIFKIMHNNMFLILHRFTGADGAGPYYGALVQGADGLLYGVTGSGGTSGNGTFFRFDPGR